MAVSFEEYDSLLERAHALARERFPEASAQKWAAFANTVAGLLTGVSGGYGGPSVREHVAGQMLESKHQAFEELTEELLSPDSLIFGPLREEHLDFWSEQSEICFDDDPDDVALLEAGIAGSA
jgi:hypothetical protein